jgi:nitroreductase
MKSIIKRYLPTSIFELLRSIRACQNCLVSFIHDYTRYMKYSASKGLTDPVKLEGQIIMYYHMIEKGLTMPNIRLGFGRPKILNLINYCREYAAKYDKDNNQLLHAVGVILEYRDFHYKMDFELDSDLLQAIDRIQYIFPGIQKTSQKSINRDDYYKYVNSDFQLFSNSRHSVRDFSPKESVPLKTVLKALELARNTPSACNRQTWRSYVITDKNKIEAILNSQGGSRGFGHLTDKLIVITAELGVFSGARERNQAFVDGGIYLMNLLYALHYYKVATCTLNCSVDSKMDAQFRKLCETKPSEVYISMIACGVASESFKYAVSKRSDLSETNRVI